MTSCSSGLPAWSCWETFSRAHCRLIRSEFIPKGFLPLSTVGDATHHVVIMYVGRSEQLLKIILSINCEVNVAASDTL